MPTCSPSGPTSRTSRARICSLTRGSTLMGPPQVSFTYPTGPQTEGPGACRGPLDRSLPNRAKALLNITADGEAEGG